MKKLIVIKVLLLISILVSCNDEIVDIPESKKETIRVRLGNKTNSWGGERGNKFEDMIIDSTNIIFHKYGDAKTGIITDTLTATDTIALERWLAIKKMIDFDEMVKVDSIIQPYNSTSYLQAWLIVEIGDKSKRIDFNYLNPVNGNYVIMPEAFESIYDEAINIRQKFGID